MLSDWNFFDFSPFPFGPDDADMLITDTHLDAEEPVERTAKLERENHNLQEGIQRLIKCSSLNYNTINKL